MTTLIVGANGATGRLLVQQLLDRGQGVRIIIRSVDKLPPHMLEHEQLQVIQASISELSDSEIAQQVQGCAAVASCLGHNMTWKGIYGHPRRLVTQAISRLCEGIKTHAPVKPVKFVLMNTTGNRNRDLDEPVSVIQRGVIGLLRIFLPPHVDNEQAADYLRVRVGRQDPSIQWSAVRPDSLIDMDTVTAYQVHRSPTRSAIFDAGKTSRINVAHFMADLITDDNCWNQWQGQMPVIYNS